MNFHFKPQLKEACLITVFCILISGLCRWLGADNHTTLIIFNIAVMSCVSVIPAQSRSSSLLLISSVTITLSCILGALLGKYQPALNNLCTLIYVIIAYSIHKNTTLRTILVLGALIFYLFTNIPINLQLATTIFYFGLLLIVIFILFFRTAHVLLPDPEPIQTQSQLINNNALFVTSTLILGMIAVHFLKQYTHLSHLYWVGLTILVVTQTASPKTTRLALIRILANIAGAIIIILFISHLPLNLVWLDFCILILLLFSIFFFGSSYTLRTLFIELFVLTFIHIACHYDNTLVFDRVWLTLTGGALVIVVSTIIYALKKTSE